MKAKLFFLLLVVLLNTQINAQCWQTVSAGYDHTVGIKTDGTLWAWGSNYYGQLGNGTTISKNTPIQVGNSNNWKFVVANDQRTFAIKTDGTLWEWGYSNKLVPTQVDFSTNWQSISIGMGWCVAIKTNGTLWTWGKNNIWELGIGSSISPTIPTQIGTDTNWQSVTAGHDHRVAIKTDGTLWAWGSNINSQLGLGDVGPRKVVPTQIGTETNWKYVSAGGNHTIALKTDGTIWSWGDNFNNQLGLRDNIKRNIPTKIQNWDGIQFLSVSAGGDHTLVIKTDGTAWSWGDNYFGQVGNGTNTTIANNYIIKLGSSTLWKSISAGSEFTVALRTNGSAYVWGRNSDGQLGNGSNTDLYSPTQIACPMLGLEEEFLIDKTISIFPNPVKDILRIQNTSNIVLDHIIVTDLTGKRVFEQNGSATQINTQDLQQGMYLLQVFLGEKRFQYKFIKQ